MAKCFEAPPECWAWAIEQALVARETGRLVTPLKGHGWLYQVMTQYQPGSAGGALVLAPEAAQAQPVRRGNPSQTNAALAALEARARG